MAHGIAHYESSNNHQGDTTDQESERKHKIVGLQNQADDDREYDRREKKKTKKKRVERKQKKPKEVRNQARN